MDNPPTTRHQRLIPSPFSEGMIGMMVGYSSVGRLSCWLRLIALHLDRVQVLPLLCQIVRNLSDVSIDPHWTIRLGDRLPDGAMSDACSARALSVPNIWSSRLATERNLALLFDVINLSARRYSGGSKRSGGGITHS